MVRIDMGKCIGCGICCRDCVSRVLALRDKKAHLLSEDCLRCGHCVAICPENAVAIDEYDQSEIKTYREETFHIDAEVLLNTIQFRRSIRNFKKQPVEREKVEKIIEAGRYTPTARNAQGVSYIVIQRDIHLIQSEAMRIFRRLFRLYKMVSKVVRLPFDVSRYHIDDDDFLFKGAPVLILVVSENVVDAALASTNMELMAEAQGLGVLYVGFFTIVANISRKIKKLLKLSRKQKTVTCLAIGYPAVRYFRTAPRKKPDVTWR